MHERIEQVLLALGKAKDSWDGSRQLSWPVGVNYLGR